MRRAGVAGTDGMSARRVAWAILWGLVAVLVVAPVGAWAAMALWFRLPGPEWAKVAAAGLAVVIALATVFSLFTRARWRVFSLFALAFGGVALWWSTILPPAGRDWAPDVARQTTGSLDGDILTLSDVREFDWTSDDAFVE